MKIRVSQIKPVKVLVIATYKLMYQNSIRFLGDLSSTLQQNVRDLSGLEQSPPEIAW